MKTRLTGEAMWRVGELLADTGNRLPRTVPAAKALTPEQIKDGFERLQALQKPWQDWSVDERDLGPAHPDDPAAKTLRTLFRAFGAIARRLEACPSPLSEKALAAVRAGQVRGPEAKRTQRQALVDLFRLANGSAERGFQADLRAHLEAEHGPAEAAITSRAPKPRLGLYEEQQRRSDAAEVLLRLHVDGRAPLPERLVMGLVAELGSHGEGHADGVLATIAARAGGAGQGALSAAATRARERIARASNLWTAQVMLEGGPIPAGGIRSYINALTRELPRSGHQQDLFLPLPGHIDPALNGMTPVAGSEGAIRDVRGEEIRFRLWKIEEPPLDPGAAARTFYFIEDDHYFTPRRGVYMEEVQGFEGVDGEQVEKTVKRDFADAGQRLVAGSMLALAAISKVAAIRKLGGGDGLRFEEVSRVEASELAPGDVPRLLQVNDAHFAVIEALRRRNPVFSELVPFGTMHNGGDEYQPWVRREHVAPLLQGAGADLQEVLACSDGAVNLMEVMLATMPIKVVSHGYLERLLNQPGAMSPRLQARLQEAFASGRIAATPNGITLGQFDPSRIEKTSQPEPYGPEDFSGKARCKTAVQAELGLPEDASAPMFLFGGRIATQKGIRDLLAPIPGNEAHESVLDVVLREFPKLQIVIGGPVEEPDLGPALQALGARHPDQVRLQLGYADNRKLMSAADVFLLPSREEPCGIADEEAMAMGLGVLRTQTDGLKDKSTPFDPLTGTGQAFSCELRDPANPKAGLEPLSLLNALRDAARCASGGPAKLEPLRKNAMERAKDFDAAGWAKNVAAFMRHVLNLKDRELGRL